MDLATRVVQLLKKQSGTSLKQKRLAKLLNIQPEDYQDFKQLLKELAAQGLIVRHGSAYLVPNQKQRVEGRIAFTNAGFALVSTSDGREIYIAPGNSGIALPNDLVLVEIFKTKSGWRSEGKVNEVLQRATEPLRGIVKLVNGNWYVVLAENAPRVNVRLKKVVPGLRPQQLVLIGNIEWSNPREEPCAEIKEILGVPTNPADDFIILLKTYNLNQQFPPRVREEVARLETDCRFDGRLDLRKQEIFTIDPPTAKDYDDAVSLNRLEDGKWLLGVHIADVSHYVPAGGATDKEARRRGTSIYCGNEVVPMLPPELSEQLCSLQPGKDKLTFSVLMTLDDNGNLLKAEFHPSVINSQRRFTYEEVQAILEREDGPHYATLLAMRDLSRLLYAQRVAQGSIDFDLPEPIFDLDADGVPLAIQISQRLDSHRIIEEFMLMANRCVAEYIAVKRRKERLPFIYRVHPQPTEEDIANFYAILQQLGLKYQYPRLFTPKHLQAILLEIQELPCKNYIEQIALRSMAKAIYSAQPLGHFGLAFRYYTHFTSPIRRYPDLVVHRLLKAYLEERGDLKLEHYRRMMPRIARQATENELLAMEVEREYTKIKQIRFLEQKIGTWYDGIITGVAEFGFFVEISKYLIDGLVHVRTLLDDYYEYDARNHTLRGRRYGRIFRLGDAVKVKLKAVSVEERRVDFEWGE